jgi:hypothetical protein
MTPKEAEVIVKGLWGGPGSIQKRMAKALLDAYKQGVYDEGRSWCHSEICGGETPDTGCRCDAAYPPNGKS